jgi:hypothetical protein
MNTNQYIYTIPFKWDIAVTIITIATIAVLLIIVFYFLYINLKDFKIISIFIVLPIVLISIGVFLYMPVKIHVQEDNITIKRIMGEHKILFKDINTIEPINKSDLDGTIRTFGSGGLFGYYGHFKNKKIGKYIMYATSKDNLIKIGSTKEVVVISCQNREEIIRYIHSAISNDYKI